MGGTFGRVGGGLLTFGASEGARAGYNWANNKDAFNEYQDQMNRQAEVKAMGYRSQLQDIQGRALPQQEDFTNAIHTQFQDLQKQNPEQLANAQIERQRRAQALGYQNQQNNINQQVARRGLGNSASGLFASLNNQRQQQNQLADLESSRFGLQRNIMSENQQMQGNLLNQYGGAMNIMNAGAQNAQIPTIDFSKSQTRWEKYSPVVGKFLNDRIKAGESIAGQAAGSMGKMGMA